MTSTFDPDDRPLEREDIDLVQLARALASAFGSLSPSGYLEGKTAMRDAIVEMLDCSELRSEELVDLLENFGFLEFDADPREAEGAEEGHWHIQTL